MSVGLCWRSARKSMATPLLIKAKEGAGVSVIAG